MQLIVNEITQDVAHVAFRGRLDGTGVSAVGPQFTEIAGSRRAILVEMSDVDFLSSIGIRLMLIGAKALRDKGGKLVIFSPKESVTDVLQLGGIDNVIPIFSERSGALAAVA